MPARIERWKPPVYMKSKRTREQEHYKSNRWGLVRKRILVRDAYRCAACSRICYGKAAHVDHIVPLEDGGTDDDANLQTLCASCHGKKTRCEQGRNGVL
jgi:5-methylcytosine-specific restriction protein A